MSAEERVWGGQGADPPAPQPSRPLSVPGAASAEVTSGDKWCGSSPRSSLPLRRGAAATGSAFSRSAAGLEGRTLAWGGWAGLLSLEHPAPRCVQTRASTESALRAISPATRAQVNTGARTRLPPVPSAGPCTKPRAFSTSGQSPRFCSHTPLSEPTSRSPTLRGPGRCQPCSCQMAQVTNGLI